MRQTLRARLTGAVVLLALFGLALLARPHPHEPTAAEQATMDRVDAQVADREAGAHPAPVMTPVTVTEAAACFRQEGFTIVRRTGTSLAVERRDAPRAAIRFYPVGAQAVSDLPPTKPGEPQWSATNNVRFRMVLGWERSTTEATRRSFFHCLNAD